jgi:mannose-6-phosphate isomerase-like protein (cupin superfamily)
MKYDKFVFSTQETTRYRFPTHVNELVLDRADAATSEAFLVVLQPGEAPPLHLHDDAEQIFYVLQGSGKLRIGGDTDRHFPVRTGDLVRIPPHTYHSILCESSGPLVYLSVDCFLNGRPESEPTWESHVRAICAQNQWDFEQVKTRKG